MTRPADAIPTRADHALYALVVCIWGSGWYGLTLQVQSGVPVLASISYRFILGAALLFIWCSLRRQSLRLSLRQHGLVAAQGVALFGANYYFFYNAAAYLASGLLSVVFSTVVIFNIVLGALFMGVRLKARVLGGALLGLAGITLVFWPEVTTLSLDDAGAVGMFYSLAGTVCAAIGMTLSAHNQSTGMKVMPGNAYGMLYGAIFCIVVTVLTGGTFPFVWTTAYVGSLVYLTVISSVIAFGAYLTLVGRIGTARASYASVLFPIMALTVSTVVEGYQWTPIAFAGVGLVLAGNVLVLVRRRPAVTPLAAEA